MVIIIFYRLEPKIDLERLSCVTSCAENEPSTQKLLHLFADCSDLYIALTRKLGEEMTDPPGYPHLSEYRMFDMFSSVQTSEKKEQVMSSF